MLCFSSINMSYFPNAFLVYSVGIDVLRFVYYTWVYKSIFETLMYSAFMIPYRELACMCFLFRLIYVTFSNILKKSYQSLMGSIFSVMLQFLYDKPAVFRKLIKVKFYTSCL